MELVAAIPYHTFPNFQLGPVTIRVFGLMVALGVVLGVVIGSRYVANRGLDAEEYSSLATKVVIVGLIGSRVTWVLTHLDQLDSFWDVFKVWEGGIQFSGGLLFGALAAVVLSRGNWSRRERWIMLDGTAIGLAAGLMLGRLGCVAVGEHFGGPTSFFLGMTYQGGATAEAAPAIGTTIHNTAFYESLHMAVLCVIFALLLRHAGDRRQPWPLGLMGGIFLAWYGVWRFLTDMVRINDARLAGLTGAQWMCIVALAAGIWLISTSARRPADEEPMVATTHEPHSAVTVVERTGDSTSEPVVADEFETHSDAEEFGADIDPADEDVVAEAADEPRH